ncbi:XdhC family protein [Marinobacterium lutimaris]|uniref:Xanthine dehydrogenase accessory factor n=1 Tax=Marinobacterium lutimaris TaxID=568106 RepID=A0A1H6C3R6_9GAMM|nr:XdhC family protein [Marinobacterium lutimaris]SEG67016.1 xanthine dehydrogenase accessory factor [Marinobacterium lutimaris]
MQHLDLQVVEQAQEWLNVGETVWLCTVLSTFGSSPREPGSIMVARADGRHLGSLSGGCVEEDFLERLQAGEFHQRVRTERYGQRREDDRPQIQLPCGGILDVLIERLEPDDGNRRHLAELAAVMRGREQRLRRVSLADGSYSLSPLDNAGGDRVEVAADGVSVRMGPSLRLIIAGLSSVARPCAEFAVSLGYEVIVCEPREEEYRDFDLENVRLEKTLPSMFIAKPGNCHQQTAVVAMTHDPRIDDLAMIEAVRTDAFYIGVMGSRLTSDKRAARLLSTGGLSADQVERIHMPIGLALGSKTPAEIALAVMADVLRVQRGRDRNDL